MNHSNEKSEHCEMKESHWSIKQTETSSSVAFVLLVEYLLVSQEHLPPFDV